MVDSVSNLLLETLRDVLVEEVKFLSGVSDEVKKVERDLRTIHGLLMEADRNRSDSPTLKLCIIELKELAFKAEKVLETYDVEVESKKEGKTLKEKLRRFIGILCECYTVHQVGNDIDDVRFRLADLTSKLQSINGGDGSSNAAHEEQQRLLRLRYAHEIEQHFVGMEKDIECLVSMVKDDQGHTSSSVISICGMGGLGKTTLARKIYHHHDVQRHFDGLAWVCVTQQFQAETILRNIFKQVDNRGLEINSMELPELVPGLYSVLEQKKCMILIDDIWESSHWDILKPAFPTNCKVVLTTRSEKVAYQERHLHKLDFLSEDEGWELLGKIALPKNVDAELGSRSNPLEKIGRQIVRKCGCLPLAISVIGGILRQKQQILAEWEKVSFNIDSYLRRGEGIGNDTQVKLVLDLSFDVLPYYLKPCFLYLACFLEDQKIYSEDLYLLWIAEGLISSEEKGYNETLKDVAERYLNELAFRCMVQMEKSDISMLTSCKLHDLMRDLCTSKAEAEMFIKRIDVSKHQHDIASSSVGGFIHRIAIIIDDDSVSTLCTRCIPQMEDLRSLLVLRGYFNSKNIDFGNTINFENSKHLRILALERLYFKDGKLPITIEKLIYLRYLSLHDSYVTELPQHVCNLQYLNTLDLRVQHDARLTLPVNLFRKMKRLRHLFLPMLIEVIGKEKLRLEGLNELETLDGINSKTACITDIIHLTNLQKLYATLIKEDADSMLKIVEYMGNSRCQLRWTGISVEFCEVSRDVVKNMLMSHSLARLRIIHCEIACGFPCYEEGMCHNLVDLTIVGTKIVGDIDLVEELGKYPSLQCLRLEGGRREQVVETELMRFGVNSFHQLKELNLQRLRNIKKWEVEKGSMPKLRELWVQGCSSLEKLPERLRFIPSLQVLGCSRMSAELKDRMFEGRENGEGAGEDYANFSHIPTIYISEF